MKTGKNVNKTNKTNQTALDLRNCSEKYSGLTISESDSTDFLYEEICDTITIVAWVRPDGSDMTLLRLDFPEMGFVSYSEEPNKK
jgi:hypothetical protein